MINSSVALRTHQMMTSQIQATQNLRKTDDVETKSTFQSIFTEQLNQTNQLQQVADTQTQQFIAGESDSLHDVMIAVEEASLSLELTTQIRNKLVEGYQELKNIQF